MSATIQKFLISALLVVGGTAAQASNWGAALGGMGQALADQADRAADQENREALLRQRHEQEMQRIRLEHELRMKELERARSAPSAPTTSPQVIAERRAAVEAAHPGFMATMISQDFKDWTTRQSQEMRDTYRQRGPVYGLIYILDAYKRDRGIKP